MGVVDEDREGAEVDEDREGAGTAEGRLCWL